MILNQEPIRNIIVQDGYRLIRLGSYSYWQDDCSGLGVMLHLSSLNMDRYTVV